MLAERASPEVARSQRTPRWPTVARTSARTPSSATRSASVIERASSSDSWVESERPTRESRMRPAPLEVAKLRRRATSSGARGRSTPSASSTPRPGEFFSGSYPSRANTPASDSGATPARITTTEPIDPWWVSRSRFGVDAASTGLRSPVAGWGRSPSPSRTTRATGPVARDGNRVGVSIIRRGRSALPSCAAARRFKGFRSASARSYRPPRVRDSRHVRHLCLSLDVAGDPGHPPRGSRGPDLARDQAAAHPRDLWSGGPPRGRAARHRGDHRGRPDPDRGRRVPRARRDERLADAERLGEPVRRHHLDQLHLDRHRPAAIHTERELHAGLDQPLSLHVPRGHRLERPELRGGVPLLGPEPELFSQSHRSGHQDVPLHLPVRFDLGLADGPLPTERVGAERDQPIGTPTSCSRGTLSTTA